MYLSGRTQCERNYVALVAHPWHSPLWHYEKIIEFTERQSSHVHKISLRAKDQKEVWKRHTMGLLSN
eukprot:11327205-Prorocentrum_lima.AAC.1